LDPSLPEDQGIYVFRPQTPFVELRQGGTTRSLMRTPLMLRLLLQAFHRRALPSDVSFDDAMALFFEQVVLQKNEPGGGYPERGVVLRAFVRELDSRGQPSLSRDQLLQVEALKVALQNTQRDSPYVQLLDHGVLLEEWEGDRCTVRFAFDGLLEYLLAERHDQRVDTADDLRGLVGRSQGFRALRGAAQIILRRALMYGRHDVALSLLDDVAMDAPRGVSGSALRSLPPSAASADEGPEVTVIKLVRDVLVELAWLGHPAYADFLRAVVATPSYADVEMLSETFDRLYVQGEAAAAEAAALAIRSEAERLGDPISRMSGALRLAQVRQHAGAVEEAHELLCEARDAAVESGEPVRVARTDMMLARILTLRGKLDDALQVFERVQLEFERVGAMAEAGEAVRGRATVSRRRGQLDEAERLTRRAIELSEQVGAVDALSKAFNNLGTILTAKKDVAGAERAFREALRLKEELGDRMSMGVTLMNLGALFFSAGDHDQAVTTWHEALQTCEQCNHLEGVAMVRVNLGVHFYYTRRELEPALDALTKSHAIFEQLEDPNHSAYACWHLAGIALDRHREEEAQRWIDRFDANVGGLEHPRFMVQRQALRLRQAISKTERIDEEAETLWSLAEAHRAERWDVEDGPAGALLDLVTYLRGEGREEESRRWLTRLKTIIGGRTFVRDAELEALAPAH
ncbi:MAG: tetratricopeptide repeat protein, partial [Myxococcota bacterium]